jgi:hypothetical protein
MRDMPRWYTLDRHVYTSYSLRYKAFGHLYTFFILPSPYVHVYRLGKRANNPSLVRLCGLGARLSLRLGAPSAHLSPSGRGSGRSTNKSRGAYLCPGLQE